MFSNFLDGETKAFAKQRDPSVFTSDPAGSKKRSPGCYLEKKVGSEFASLGHHAIAKLVTMMTECTILEYRGQH